ncbi:SDR family NAD(P)-dependent oxidoreductase [Longimicrobium terrae]|uniref:NAD(P)-dependent dehydrogenase (Short-subunit alcohol dehydrogenase family) n=1 Tax=Longimicrobium terrae TaxID=1639882 RepID=A0A841GVH6_9BACT|nr:SDR family oxidoreductase [Longimicrobium terrae]MBB4634295.1 NAD(P)-dependent dehydrogenase (short-subunit alcohol dehydrogenase family) [Longimicrobium terrae]MBB6068815.1 NAD(P)-dependent dehydrogenase (short-subunit alcohol dehydrogenase family) [Longimicrobium terrae]NNC27999.1 SDR family oxidoreductase [Longimicrobium terrae]
MSDRVALVTGGTGGLGRAVIAAFLDAGWRVAVPTHRSGDDALAALASEHGDRLTSFAADLTTEEGATLSVQRTTEWAGGLDAVVHTVGGYAGGPPLHETSIADWDRMMDINLRGAFLLVRAAVPRIRPGGAMVFVSSRAALTGRRGHAAYAISKAALLTLTEAVAEENRGRLRVNAVLPGTIDTPANRAAMPGADTASWTAPEEIARVILFLASSESGAVTGATVPVDGRSLYKP